MKLQLEFMSGAQDGEELSIRKTSLIGRDQSSELNLSLDKYISRKHARLVVDEPNVYLEDLGSTNGTFYAGERIQGRVRLQNKDFFRVGRTWIYLSW